MAAHHPAPHTAALMILHDFTGFEAWSPARESHTLYTHQLISIFRQQKQFIPAASHSSVELHKVSESRLAFLRTRNFESYKSPSELPKVCKSRLAQGSQCTPIYIAAQNGHAAVTKQLIEARCIVDLQIKDGRTPLYTASQKGGCHEAAD